jgi:hypothetical protein
LADKCENACLKAKNIDETLVSSTLRQSSYEYSWSILTSTIPALLTKISSFPKAAAVFSIERLTSSSQVASQGKNSASRFPVAKFQATIFGHRVNRLV